MKELFSAIALWCLVALVSSQVSLAQSRPEQGAQARPNFAGTWTVHRAGGIENSGNRNDAGLDIAPAQSSLMITQDAESLTVVERFSVFPENKVVYRFDGQTVRNPFRFRLTTVPSEVTSRWQDDRLISSIAAMVPGEVELRRFNLTLSLNPSGFLVVRYDDGSNSRTVIYKKRESE